ncbi:FkbM family methyltransferase [Desulfolithobacter sp.]
MLELFLERQGQQYLDHVVLNEGDTVVEGGMFDGTNTKQFAQLVGPKGKVIAFDPLPVPVSDLPSQVRVERMALWKEAATLYLVNKGADSSVCRQPGPETVPVQAVGLDGYLQGEHIDYIKLDVEGVEKEVLLGAADTIQRHRPQLAVSIYHSPDDFFQIPQTLFSMCPNYLFYLESYSPSMGDKILIAIPEEKNMTATEIQ